jgi:hypothetical protein
MCGMLSAFRFASPVEADAATIMVNEGITVTDSSNVLPPVSIADNETISISDSPIALPPVSISVNETVSVTDSPVVLPPVSITDDETISVVDSPAVYPAPTVGSQIPTAGSTGVALNAAVSALFNQTVSTVDLSKVTISPDPGGVSATLNADGFTINIAHNNFANGTKYTVDIPAGAVKNGNNVSNLDVTWSFTSITVASTKATLTFLGSYPNPSVVGQSVQFIAVVLPSSGSNTPIVTFNNGQANLNSTTQESTASKTMPTGKVVFKDNGTTIGPAVILNNLGIATITSISLTAGQNTITAEYSGDNNYGSSVSSPVTQTVKFSTSTKVTSSLTTTAFGQSVTFTATVSSLGGTPNGTVTFKDVNTTLANGNDVLLDGTGKATFTTSSLSAGVHDISAVYNGNNSFANSTGIITQRVNKADSTIKVASSSNPSKHGQSVTFTATVSAVSPGAGIPTGKVTFKDGNNTLGTATLNALGIATYSTSSLSIGSHNITSTYMGDNNFNNAASVAISQTVN